MITRADLKGVKAFKGVEDGAIALAASRSAEIRLDKDDVLINEGDSPRFFAVVSGALEAKKVRGTEELLTTFRAGDSFGEVPLVLGSPAVVTVRATEKSHLAALDLPEFWRLVRSQKSFTEAITADLSARIKGLFSTAMLAPEVKCTIVGDPRSKECHRLRDFLTRLHVPFDWEERDGPEYEVKFADGRRLDSPKFGELARALELRTEPRGHCYDVAIVGAGPAGLAAAVYGASEGLRTILVEKDAPGGQAGMSSRIENYLGFPNGISGEELADRAYHQVERFGADVVVTREAIRIEGDAYDRRIVLDGEDGEAIHCRAIVLATGVAYRQLVADRCDEFFNCGVYYGAAQAEAQQVAGKRIHLLGGGNSAGQAAMFFSEYADSVSIIIRASDLDQSMSEYLIKELRSRPNVSVISNSKVVGVDGRPKALETIVLQNVVDGSKRSEPTHALFVFIGADANTKWLDGFVATDEKGYVLTGKAVSESGRWPLSREPHLLETNQPGVFAVGDVRQSSVKRVASSVGEGATAITMVHQILAELAPRTEHSAVATRV
jgi:thioredoxin reductase (NADPH)